ncbi:LemA family protein [Roseateles chitosanitabidus]|uniref:LemA family protein n=1 Tax=Roseateles chitosanitabidus TaxID=65048 RepID=UPI00082CE055|nr:LemA family protein [Roseateles chitosanitabidus]MBO9686720.1 LemA family protein [Roseateles chitosanitabidus]
MHWNWWLWGLGAVLLFWCIGAYNRVMLLRGDIAKAFAQFDDALTRRFTQADLLLEKLRERLPSEQASLDALAAAQAEAKAAAQAVRSRPHAADPVAQLAVAAAVHGAALTRLVSLVEHHAELSADPDLGGAVDELKLIERQRAFSRQVFNQAVTAYNEAVRQFPTRVLMSFVGFGEARSL